VTRHLLNLKRVWKNVWNARTFRIPAVAKGARVASGRKIKWSLAK
jgi:hypothetical protein